MHVSVDTPCCVAGDRGRYIRTHPSEHAPIVQSTVLRPAATPEAGVRGRTKRLGEQLGSLGCLPVLEELSANLNRLGCVLGSWEL